MSLKLVHGSKGKKERKKNTNEPINFKELREQKIEERREMVERVLFNKMLGVYSIVEGNVLKSVELLDISTDGVSFQMSADMPEVYQKGDEIKIRLYFSQDTYLSAVVEIKNASVIDVDGRKTIRYGAIFDKSLKSYDAVKSFAQFIKIYSQVCVGDDNRLPIFF